MSKALGPPQNGAGQFDRRGVMERRRPMKGNARIGFGMVALVLGLVASCAPPPASPTPEVRPDVPLRAELRWAGSYSRDIQPIFIVYCVECHGPTKAENGLRLDTYEGVMKGTQYGPVVKPGQPSLSNLLALVKHETSPEIWMPYHRQALSNGRVRTIENWIKMGAPNN